jgi:predicted N-formylglutamate amidohydrolase
LAHERSSGSARETAAPFIRNRASSLAPFVLTCEHATRRLPVSFRRSAELSRVLASHWGWDIGAWSLTRALGGLLEASALGGRWSRLWIDLNRPIDDATLIRAEAGGVELPWNRRLSPRQVERRILEQHAPYHNEVDRLIVRRLVRGVRPLLIAVHSFTPELDGERRTFDVGVLYREYSGAAHELGAAVEHAGLSVRYNEPYSGIAGLMYAVERHGTHHGLCCLELELNQRLFERPGAAARLARVLARPLRRLVRRR